ncbi:glycosyl transferase family protein [Sphingobium sp. HBC34]|uniref:Glycosyl transferase family protein n=1 Tax=Sphingobium cyanobacteriorum TaxID=3063954 RepID=A0ABT8ZIM9_9SPHN|nr:glycosyl transferase family protein [Sphingobium sp. HBC34]MDO7834286.1 glycosyl transferase family protein [Sphingobium sp. HBC34]
MLGVVLQALYRETLLFAAVGLAIGGLDDLIVDWLFLCRKYWRDLIIYARHPRMTTATLPASASPGRIAIFIPAWREAEVIAPMLRHALACWRDADYRLFVGVYPNDPDTIDAITPIVEGNDRIIVGINPRAGPSTKADCLNVLWAAMQDCEARDGIPFKAVVLHDAEDVVHPDEIRLFDFLIDRFHLVQLPVLPLPGRGGWLARAIANHYCDEFAESHGRLMTVREALGASIPSAGVACAFERQMLGRLADPLHGGPFDPSSLTEDYEAGLKFSDMGGRGIFVRMRDAQGALVATREYFPDTIDSAVRQKARWMVGISLAGWDRMGWRGGPAEWWMRVRDRRATIAALVLLAAYLALILWSAIQLLGLVMPLPRPSLSPLLSGLLLLNLGLMAWRTAMRALFVGRAYGWRYGLGAIPRTVIANYIAILAARRAICLYGRSLLGKPLRWDKTQHRFPDIQTPA